MHYFSLLLVRVGLPATLLICIALRPFGFSLVYVLLFLISATVPVPELPSFKEWRGIFFLFTSIVSSLMLLCHMIWHTVLAMYRPYGSLLEKHPLMKTIGLNLGLISYLDIERTSAAFLIAPEFISTAMSIFTCVVIKRLHGRTKTGNDRKKVQSHPFATLVGRYVCVLLIMCAGIMRPSITSGIYYLVFIGAATAWALGSPLEKTFATVCRCLMALMGLHVIVLIVYQSTWAVAACPPDSEFARYFGLTKLVTLNETNAGFMYEVTKNGLWGNILCPFVILATYLILAIESRELFKPKPRKNVTMTGVEAGKHNGSLVRGLSFARLSKRAPEEGWRSASRRARVAFKYVNLQALRDGYAETDPLMHTISPGSRPPRPQSGPRQDSKGSIIITDEQSNPVPDGRGQLKDEVVEAVVDFFQVLIRSSYIATTITMMAWSIMFHSWLTFVLLMWANLVWLCPNQRSFMLRTSPVLVVYAVFLLLAQYLYGMDLTEEELPSNVTSMQLDQIGLRRPENEPFRALFIKSLFTCMFWVTLRQRVQDIKQRKRAALITDMAAPLQLTVTTAGSGMESRDKSARSRLLLKLGDFLQAAAARYWIYVVVIMLFIIGITGESMTIFRIIYMFLFLGFVLMFQISWYWWRRLMYTFWIVVIIYSMINLILLYIYQFDDFSKIIEKYLLINEKLQQDLGLEPYHPADLFVKLLTPTLFLIMTIMQVHYFHKDFMAFSSGKMGTSTISQSQNQDHDSKPASQAGASTMKDDLPPLSEDEQRDGDDTVAEVEIDMDNERSAGSTPKSIHKGKKHSRQSYKQSLTEPHSTAIKQLLKMTYEVCMRTLSDWIEKIFMFLEMHLLKIVFISCMLLCVMNVAAIHVPIMLIISPALWLRSSGQRFLLLCISTLLCVYFMAKMVYQIDYIKHSSFDVTCEYYDTNGTFISNTFNNAKWAGFVKATREKPLLSLLKGYIGVLSLFTFYFLVLYRQQALRGRTGIGQRNKVMFTDITREHADIDLVHCIKYFFNYGFYKFGVEITLICLMGVIGSRMDIYAVFYAGWLLVMVTVNRKTLARLWTPFTVCVTILIPLQYMIAVGFLPQFCMRYLWEGDQEGMQHLRTWLYLPYTSVNSNSYKVAFDYFLLLFATRQVRVFRIEAEIGDNYPGGSNSEDIGKDWETRKFVNPVPDFLSTAGSWLDVIKRIVFLGMLWVTLALMFMAGTNRVNLFSMGYLVGSFIFLWQGTDFYLRPKEDILMWWSWLLRFNVTVVVMKTLLQIPGCLFPSLMQEHSCWLVQLLGIGCVDKFAGGNIAAYFRMRYVKEAICSVPQEDIGLAWDGVSFAFLILQRRLFHSYYFYRVIDESKATTVLASRGAELIEKLRVKQMQCQKNQESEILVNIKLKMERIKANQKKIAQVVQGMDQGRNVWARPSYHFVAKDHHSAIRSGDYYMFDEYHDTEIPVKETKSLSDEDLPHKEIGFASLVSKAMKTDLRHAVSIQRLNTPLARSRATQDVSVSTEGQSQKDRKGDTSESQQDDAEGRASDIDDYASIPAQETIVDKFRRYIEIVWAFVSSILVSLTRHIMKYSRDYRYVSRALTLEKKILKEKEGFGIGIREGSQMIWEPLPHLGNGLMSKRRKLSEISVPEIRILAPSMERGLDASPVPHRPLSSLSTDTTRHVEDDDDDTSEHESIFSLRSSVSKDVSALEDQDESMLRMEQNPFVRLINAIWYMILAHTDVVCYIMVFINQIQSATILSIPLPLMVFMWGTLTIPRPTKTFWVTLIAYTEVIVLIKSMFQFEILPWNQKAIPTNMPFTAPRIIGIERKYNYALYDLLLLLIIFLHRFMLKSLGLWKETTPEIELRGDCEYPMTTEDLQLIEAGQSLEVGEKYVKLHNKTGPRSAKEKKPVGDIEEIPEGNDMVVSPKGNDVVATPERNDNQDINDEFIERKDDVEAGPSKPPEDDQYYRVDDDQEPIIAVTTTLEETKSHYPKVICLSVKRYLQPMKVFFRTMLAPGARVTADVYAYMFLCDFCNFLVVIFGFAAFGTHQGDGGVQAYLEENKVPIPFLVMLILQFTLILVDRGLYLRKFMLGKILFQYALIIGVHIWMFFVLPFITERTFNTLWPPPLWYMLKCIYLLLSAYQIRCGYPRRIIGNFLCKSYNFLNMVFFRAFMAIPFLFELRALMDWMWTDTSMTLIDWLKMEDIFASVFLLKCSRYLEDEYPQPRGVKKSTLSKYVLGGGVLAFIIAIIWFPLVFFAFGNTVGEPNPPTDVTVKIRIGPFLPVYQMSAQAHNIEVFTEQDFNQLSNMYARDRTAQTFLSNYMYNDIAVVTLNPNSTMNWDISRPELERLEREVQSNESLTVTFTFVITHFTNAVQNPPTIEDHREVTIRAFTGDKLNPQRSTLRQMLEGTAPPASWLTVEKIFPKFVKVFNKGIAKPAYQLMTNPPDESEDARLYRNVQLRLERSMNAMYWRVREDCSIRDPLLAVPFNDCNLLVMYTFNDKLFPDTLNFISGSGILGLYTTFVFLASRVLRGFFTGIYTKIMFDDLPNVDRVLQLCLDIYLVREALELALEEDLFAKLVFLYRSPETMIKWSRPKEQTEQQQALPPS